MARYPSGDGYRREGHKGLPFAGNPITDHDSILDFYFSHPTSSNEERPLGPLHGSSDFGPVHYEND